MTEINQLERAKLALVHGLRIQCWMDEEWKECATAYGSDVYQHRVHSDDNEALDAVIWEGVGDTFTYAYIMPDGQINCFTSTDYASKEWPLIATRELPAEEWDEERINVIAQNGNTGEHYESMSPEEKQLVADLKEFVADVIGVFSEDESPIEFGSIMHKTAEALLNRINPKPVCKCCGQVLVEKDD